MYVCTIVQYYIEAYQYMDVNSAGMNRIASRSDYSSHRLTALEVLAHKSKAPTSAKMQLIFIIHWFDLTS